MSLTSIMDKISETAREIRLMSCVNWALLWINMAERGDDINML